jgi:predicted helicase
MSLQLIQQYYNKLDKALQYGGSHNESALRFAFQTLLSEYAAGKGLQLIPELDYKPAHGATVRPDGTLKDGMRLDWGYWESKDQYDTLDDEIAKKLAKGYPTTNILFEDGQTAVLIQTGAEAMRVQMQNAAALDALLAAFFGYEPPQVADFRAAIESFKADLPALVEELRGLIEQQAQTNPAFALARQEFLTLCQRAINPALTMTDVREMIIQHILTEEIFVTIFSESQFHRENNIARELARVIDTFLTGALRHNILARMNSYYQIIKAAAAGIADHHEKQRFLKVVYENFYKAYNPKGADRLGIVYTPAEIVRFMIEGAEHLVYQHFARLLGDEDVQILDPATGTGTFVTELIEHLPKSRLPYKYANEIHCNEVAILPYYIANLNIEYAYAQKMGQYAEFTNICFVDTLDNLAFVYDGKQGSLFDLTDENLERIQRQNERRISVIIGNPPYNANQLNENENNKNRTYPGVDKRIKATYIKQSTAQKTKLYDMYARFLRWASDRLDKNGVIAFVLNRSFIDARTYDGFRKVVADEFDEIWALDLGGDVRKNPKLSGTTHNVFGIQTGVALCFLVRRERAEKQPCRIYYARRPEMETARDKLQYLASAKFQTIPFAHIIPDKQNTWINQAENEWDELIPVAAKETKFAKRKAEEQAIFKLFSLGVITARDDWVYDEIEPSVKQKIEFLIGVYNQEVDRLSGKLEKAKIADALDYSIKWTRAVKRDLARGVKYTYQSECIFDCLYRPFAKRKVYFSRQLNEMQYQMPMIFPTTDSDNIIIAVNVGNKPFNVLASKYLVDYHFNGDSQCFPLYRYDADGQRQENITDWALKQFREQYGDKKIRRADIFHYVYAVLHDPAYRSKYALNLKREFPRLPFYADFRQWAGWGERLMSLHLDYETIAPYPLRRIETPADPNRPPAAPLPRLRADKVAGRIELDSVTALADIPAAAWEYKLGNRSALEWVLDRYKESKPSDPTIRERFNSYRFADYKEQVIELLGRVCAVSVETVKIVEEMKAAPS